MYTQCVAFLLGHCDEADVVLWVAAGLGVTDDIHCVLLGLQSCGQEVSITHVFTVVHTKRRQSGLMNPTIQSLT